MLTFYISCLGLVDKLDGQLLWMSKQQAAKRAPTSLEA